MIKPYSYSYIYISQLNQQPTRTYADLLRRLAYADPTQTYALQAKCYAADFQCSRLYVALLVEKKRCSRASAKAIGTEEDRKAKIAKLDRLELLLTLTPMVRSTYLSCKSR